MKSSRSRGKHYPRLATAVSSLREKLRLDKKPFSLPSIAEQIATWLESDGEEISLQALTASLNRLCSGGNIMPDRAVLLTEFFEEQFPQFIAPTPLDECFIDLKNFLYVKDSQFSRPAASITGTYQTYAVATSVDQYDWPTEQKYIRRGSISFEYETVRNRLLVFEKQRRQTSDDFEEYEMSWSGYGTPVNDAMYVSVMRTDRFHDVSTPLFYMFWQIRMDSQRKSIVSMMANSIGFDPDMEYPTFPRVYMERVKDVGQLHHDFVKSSSIKNSILKKVI